MNNFSHTQHLTIAPTLSYTFLTSFPFAPDLPEFSTETHLSSQNNPSNARIGQFDRVKSFFCRSVQSKENELTQRQNPNINIIVKSETDNSSVLFLEDSSNFSSASFNGQISNSVC